MDQDRVEAALIEALQILYEREHPIISRDAGERTITARLARYLEDAFTDHAVHHEYNRHGIKPKEIDLPEADGVLTRVRVFPDIIVHQVGHDDENILVIEAKKTTNSVSDEHDIAKLRLIKHQMAYRYAVFLRLPAGQGARVEDIQIEWI